MTSAAAPTSDRFAARGARAERRDRPWHPARQGIWHARPLRRE